MSYSQSGEEAAILRIFPAEGLVMNPEPCELHEAHVMRPSPPGRFLDIGACRPKELSNTRALYERGWRGVMFEPEPFGMLKLIDEYGREPRITLVEAAVGKEAGLRDFYVLPSTSASSGPRPADNSETGAMLVQYVTLEQILRQFGGDFQFVNIDTEGTSTELAIELVRLTREVQCICVEWEHQDQRELLAAMTAADYALRYSNGENGVWQKMTWEEMHP